MDEMKHNKKNLPPLTIYTGGEEKFVCIGCRCLYPVSEDHEGFCKSCGEIAQKRRENDRTSC